VKYRLGAALSAVAFILMPGALLAGSASESIATRDFDTTTHTVTGLTSSWALQKLRHTAATTHNFVRDPSEFPPGPYRTFAIQWNLAVFQNKSASTFDKLLSRATELGMVLDVERTDKASADGSFELVQVTPVR
jgi:hypothetical protein